MKKILALLLTAALATAAATTAFADDKTISADANGNPNPADGQSTQVTYTVQPTYTVIIPAEVKLNNSKTVSATVKAKDVRIKNGQNLVIKVASENKTNGQTTFVAKTTEGAKQAYTINKKPSTSTGSSTSGSSTGNLTTVITPLEEVAQGGEVLKVNSETAENELQALLLFTVGTGSTYAGEYTDTLIFTVSVE